MAFISMRTPAKFQGLINVSGFNVDPGYKGKLIYAVFNTSPSSIQLCENDRLFKIWFADLDESFDEKYIYGQPGIEDISSDLTRGMGREILSLQSLADKIRNLDTSINQKLAEQKPTIDGLMLFWRALVISAVVGVVGTILIALFTYAAPILWAAGLSASEKMLSTQPVSGSPSGTAGEPEGQQ